MTYYLARSAETWAEKHRARTCTRKRRHLSRWGACEAIRSVGDEALVPYRCDHCGGWHIGHKPQLAMANL